MGKPGAEGETNKKVMDTKNLTKTEQKVLRVALIAVFVILFYLFTQSKTPPPTPASTQSKTVLDTVIETAVKNHCRQGLCTAEERKQVQQDIDAWTAVLSGRTGGSDE